MALSSNESKGQEFLVSPDDVRAAVRALQAKVPEAQFARIREVCPDWFMEAALYARENHIEQAIAICIRHEQFLTKNKWYRVDPASLAPAMGQGLHKLLHKRDVAGRVVFTFDFPQVNFDEYSVENCQQVAFFLLKNALQDEEVRKKGFTMLVDLRGFTFKVLRSIGRRDRSRGIGMIQNCLPVRMKSIIVMNEGWVTRLALRMVMPFVNKKIRKRIHYFGKRREEVLKHIGAELLPDDLGGSVSRKAWEQLWTERAKGVVTGDFRIEGMASFQPMFGGSTENIESPSAKSPTADESEPLYSSSEELPTPEEEDDELSDSDVASPSVSMSSEPSLSTSKSTKSEDANVDK